jgi:prepilin peptidase CpaA
VDTKLLIHLLAILVAATACVTDLRSRRISNRLVLGGGMLGLLLNFILAGWAGCGWSLLGGLLGLALFLPFFALGGMGAGDVKLLACLGILVGPGDLTRVALVGALLGGAMALIVATVSGRLGDTLKGCVSLMSFWMAAGIKPSPALQLSNPETLKIPYAVPVAAGTFMVLLSRWSW